MVAQANLVEVAALVGDTARATMLAALMDGRALTAGELAYLAHIAPSTASGHLGKLAAARLVSFATRRRFRYYRLASPRVAQMLESIKAVAAIDVPPRHQPRSAQDDAIRFARTCYDHLAGRLGVAIADAMIARGEMVLTDDGGEVTTAGEAFLTRFGARIDRTAGGRRLYCRPCLDWSERRYHVAGRVGAEICRRCLELGWVARMRDSRALRLTPTGRAGLRDAFGVEFGEASPAVPGRLHTAPRTKELQKA
jgi:DNA-binding transcriptional ArsR family regulator